MKRLLAVGLLALSLAGCSTLSNIGTAISIGTTSIANPVTKERLYEVENAAIVLASGLNAWKRACIEGAIPVACRAQIANVQIYTRQIGPYLVSLRKFVKTNDQVNAVVVFNQLSDVIGIVKNRATAAGQTVGG